MRACERLSARRSVARCAVPVSALVAGPTVARRCTELARVPCTLACVPPSHGPIAEVEDRSVANVADWPTRGDTSALRPLAAPTC